MVKKLNFGNMKFLSGIENFLKENASTFSMVGGIACIAGAIYAAFKASDEVSTTNKTYVENKKQIETEAISEDEKAVKLKDLKTNRNVKLILAYKYVLLLGGSAIGLTLLTQYLNGITITGLTALAISKENEIKAMLKNGKEMIGEEKFKEIEDKSLEDIISEKFFGDSNARRVSPRDGHLVIDTDSATIFQINEDDLIGVLQHAEDYCNRNHGLSQAKFFEMLGFVESPTNAREKWWGPNRPFKAHVSNRTYLGAQIPSIEYSFTAGTAWSAGIPGAKRPF